MVLSALTLTVICWHLLICCVHNHYPHQCFFYCYLYIITVFINILSYLLFFNLNFCYLNYFFIYIIIIIIIVNIITTTYFQLVVIKGNISRFCLEVVVFFI